MDRLSYYIPFLYVKNIRYYQGIKIFSYIFNELLPIFFLCVLFVDFDQGTAIQFILYWALFWTIYEIGYFVNDTKNRFNKIKSTRPPQDFSLSILILWRILFSIFLAIVCVYLGVSAHFFFMMIIFVLPVFLVHNLLPNYKYRLITVFWLGWIRLAIIPLSFGVKNEYVIALFMYPIIVKIIDYWSIKIDSSLFGLRKFYDLRLFLSASFVPFLYIVYPMLLLPFASFLFFDGLNYYRKYLQRHHKNN